MLNISHFNPTEPFQDRLASSDGSSNVKELRSETFLLYRDRKSEGGKVGVLYGQVQVMSSKPPMRMCHVGYSVEF
ncbi:uncharacterized protein G2W53_029593 [Senna tora]|uniref:Uncharacterized protein n=1 Tax=Senna tora TaxID=362788 RepID=A0A834TED9_9FABA|nr:uncharacterized protein G2W53_029593 [Senna tora]